MRKKKKERNGKAYVKANYHVIKSVILIGLTVHGREGFGGINPNSPYYFIQTIWVNPHNLKIVVDDSYARNGS